MLYALLTMYVLVHKVKNNTRNEVTQSYQRRHDKTTEVNLTRSYIKNKMEKISKNYNSGVSL